MILRKTLSIIMVLGLLIGGLPIFFSQSAEAAAVVVVERDDGAHSLTDSKGYLYVDVSRFEDEGGEPIPGYTMLVEWDYCYMELNPLAGFLQTKRVHKTATLISDEKGEASYVFELPNGCWTENAWLRGAAQGWQSPPDYFLGQMASRSLHLDLYTQPSGATGYAIARADTLGIIQSWYEMDEYDCSITFDASHFEVLGSKSYAGAAKFSVTYTPSPKAKWSDSLPSLTNTPSATAGTIQEYVRSGQGNAWGGDNVYQPGQLSQNNFRALFGSGAYIASGFGADAQDNLWVSGSTTINNPMSHKISNCTSPGGTMTFQTFVSGDYSTQKFYQVRINGETVIPSTGSYLDVSVRRDHEIQLPEAGSIFDLDIRTYTTGGYFKAIPCAFIMAQKAEWILSSLGEDTTETQIDLGVGTVTIDLSGHWGEWQISGMSSTLTDEDLVPVNARITGIYPMVISNPRFDRTPIAGAGNGLKFDVYNLESSDATATVYLSLIADDNTTVWSTTVGQASYPAWVNESQFTTVHLTDISFPAEPRKEYNLRITSGGAITEIPVVFYPAELDPDELYEQKEELDEIRDSFATANAAALKAYYDWAVEMELLNVEMASQIENYSKIFENLDALDELEAAKDASLRAAEMITALKEICKGDPAGTNIGELEALGQGIWNSYLAALLHREAAVGYEAGDTAFANSTASDAWYIDLNGMRIYVGWNDKGGEYNDPSSLAMWIGLAVALIAGGLVFLVSWTRIPKLLPKGGSKAMKRIKAVAPLLIAVVAAVVVALVGFFVTAEIVVGVEAALADLGSLFG